MSLAPPLILAWDEAERLLRYMQAYRRHSLACLPPTQQRNTTLRLIQTLQGRLDAQNDRSQGQVAVSLNREEAMACKTMAQSLLTHCERKGASPELATTISDLGKLAAFLKPLLSEGVSGKARHSHA